MLKKSYIDIDKIVSTDELVDMVDIEVDTPDNTFILGNGILSHNSNVGVINQLSIGAKITGSRGSFLEQYGTDEKAGILGVNSAMVPFIGSTDGCRVMFAGSQGRQSIPINGVEPPIIQTGYESLMTNMLSNSYIKKAVDDGYILKITVNSISIKLKNGRIQRIGIAPEKLQSGQGQSSINYFKPIVTEGETVKKGQIIAEGKHIVDGMISQGTNLLCAIMVWKGYSYEDGYIISDRVAKDKLKSSAYHEIEILIGKNDNIISIAQEGTETKRGESLLVRTSKEVENIVGLDEDELVQGQIITKSPGGRIISLEIYPNGNIKSYPALKEAFEKFRAKYEEIKGDFPKKFVAKVFGDKEQFSGVLIRFGIEEFQTCELGDKLTNCYDKETEVLTNSGWKLFKDVTLDDKFASLNILNNLEYINAVDIHHYSNVPNMYKIKNQNIDLVVTPNHKMYVRHYKKPNSYQLIEAQNIFGKHVRYKKNANISGGLEPSTFVFPAIKIKSGQGGRGFTILPEISIPIECYLAILGAYISDGSIIWQEKHGDFGISIAQTKIKNKLKLEELLDKYNIKWIYNSQSIKITGKQIALHFKQFGKSYQKFLPSIVFTYSGRLQKILFDWLMWGDGSYSSNGDPCNYVTTSKQLADDIQRLCLHIGWAANIRPKDERGKRIIICGRLVKNIRFAYNVGIISKKLEPSCNHGAVKSQKIQEEKYISYNDDVWCVELPINHTLYVRRNGIPVWSGNSYGGKGTVAKIEREENMPLTPWGERVQIILNPLAIINRMNPSTIKELQLSLVSKTLARQVVKLGIKRNSKAIKLISEVLTTLDRTKDRLLSRQMIEAFTFMSDRAYSNYIQKMENNNYYFPIIVPPFQEPTNKDILKAMKIVGVKPAYYLHLPEYNVKTSVPISVGYLYYKKLEQQSGIKMSARSTGMIDPKTKQATAGRKAGGGQKIGELDSWSIINHGAINILREFFGPLSDDHVTKNEIISDIIQTGTAEYRTPRSSPTREIFYIYLRSMMLEPDIK